MYYFQIILIPYPPPHNTKVSGDSLLNSWFARDVTKKKNTKLKSLLSFDLDQLQKVLKIYQFACFQLGTVLRFENRAV